MNMNVIELVLSNGFSTDRELLGSPTVSGALGDGERRSEAPLGQTPETRLGRVSNERVDALVMPSHSQRRHALR